MKKQKVRRLCPPVPVLACCLMVLSPVNSHPVDNDLAPHHPRLFGMNIGKKNYDDPLYQEQIAKLDAVILGFHRRWNGDVIGRVIGRTVKDIKDLNPNILIGQYTVVSEAHLSGNSSKSDISRVISDNNWWLKDANNKHVQWTDRYNTWEVNNTKYTTPNSNGERYPQWYARRQYNYFFSRVPFDIWYFDNVMLKPRYPAADWNSDGKNEISSAPLTQSAYRQGQTAYWDAAKALNSKILFLGNPDNDLSSDEYRNRLQGAFLECFMGKRWSVETKYGWHKAMLYYQNVIENTLPPKLVVFHVCGDIDDKQTARFSFASSLLYDGWFSYTDKAIGYSSAPWFPEFDIDLGKAVGNAQESIVAPDLFSREFEKGMVVVNPNRSATRKFLLPQEFSPFSDAPKGESKQENVITLGPRDGFFAIRHNPHHID